MTDSLLKGLVASLIVLAVGLDPARAMAHPLIDEAVKLYQEGRLQEAEAAFARAETRADLRRQDLVELYFRRALLRFALRRDEKLETDLLRLASLDPYHPLDDTAPPALRERFDRVRSRIDDVVAVRVEVRRRAGEVQVSAHVEHDPARLVRRIAIEARSEGGPWSTGEGGVRLPVDSAGSVAYRARAIGPGGAIVAAASDEAVQLAPRTMDVAPEEDSNRGASAWPWIGAGAGVAVIAAVVTTLVVVRAGGTRTQLDPPTAAGF